MTDKSVFPLQLILLFFLISGLLFGVTRNTTKKKRVRTATATQARLVASFNAKTAAVTPSARARPAARLRRKAVYSPWSEPTYADSTLGDNVDGEDLEVRQAAVEALGPFNGTVVVADPASGRILTMVNQKLALAAGFQPCSTIKVPVAFAALSEGLISGLSQVRLYGGTRMNLTYALAKSNNVYFANLGIKLGYDRMAYYAHLFGLGEKAGWDIPGEQPGRFPPAPPKNGGMGMLTSFGEEISLTPLELAGIMTAIANGGTLYYLQYPRSEREVAEFQPRVKRQLDIASFIPEVKPGMQGAVEFGTARRAYDPEDPIFGKTGTCSEGRTHLGWFGSFNDYGRRKLVVVVLLTGGRPSIGPMAAGVAGDVYKRLSERNFFAAGREITPGQLISTQVCCGQ